MAAAVDFTFIADSLLKGWKKDLESCGKRRRPAFDSPSDICDNKQSTNRRVEDGIVENGGKWVG